MAARLKLEGLPGELADRARTVFGGVVNDLDRLLKALASKLDSGAAPPRRELLKLVAALRKSLDARLSALEKAIGGGKPRKKAAARAPAKKRPAARKAPAKAVRRKR